MASVNVAKIRVQVVQRDICCWNDSCSERFSFLGAQVRLEGAWMPVSQRHQQQMRKAEGSTHTKYMPTLLQDMRNAGEQRHY